MNAYLLDDEPNGLQLLRWQLNSFFSDIQVVGQQTDPFLGLAEIKNLKPDLLFLDIQMPGKNGFEVLEDLKENPPLVIFTTAFDQFAIKAIRFSALDYLLKPIDTDDLRIAIDKAKDRQTEGRENDRIINLLENLANTQKIAGKIAISSQEGISFHKIDQIIHCESEGNYTTLFLVGNKKIVATKKLKEFEEMLTDFQFVRIHNSHLINLNHLERYIKTEGGSVEMSDGSILPIARSRKDEFLLGLEAI